MMFAVVENNFLVFLTTITLLTAIGGYGAGNKKVGFWGLVAFICCVILCAQFDTAKKW